MVSTDTGSERARGRLVRGIHGPLWLCGAFVVLGLLLTWNVVGALRRHDDAEAARAFGEYADRMVAEVIRRTQLFEYGLRGARGTLVVRPDLDLQGWRDYAASRQMEREFHGALGFGYIVRVPREAIADYERRQRPDLGSDFRVFTMDGAELPHVAAFVIQWIEPLDRNRAAQGLDVGSEPRRREAAERAMRTGRAALTAPIDLVQVSEVHRGFLYLLPVYRHGAPVDTEADRERSLLGWVYAPIVMNEAMAGLMDFGHEKVDVEVFDGERTSSSTLLFDGDGHLADLQGDIDEQNYARRRFSVTHRLVVGGRPWQVRVSSHPRFEAEHAGVSHLLAWLVGTIVTISVTIVAWTLVGARDRAYAFAREVTRALEKRNAELAEARRIAEASTKARGRFLADMSHELRTPMTAIIGFADYLTDHEIDVVERAEYAAAIARNGDHMMCLINEVLDFSKIEAGRMSVEHIDTSLIEIVDDVHMVLRRRAADKGLEFDVAWRSRLPDPILCDPTRLRQILMNLVGNAIKFTDHGGIRIEVEHLAGARERIQVRVVDTGKGMNQEQQLRLFEPFVQADDTVTRQHGGTGLGLAISRQLAQLLGGDLYAQCEIGSGCSFVLDLPLAIGPAVKWRDGNEAQRVVAPVKRTDAPSLHGRVLLVDDGADNRRLIGLMLKRSGVIVSEVVDGQQAVDAVVQARSAGQAFDLVLMDMQMPVMDGVEATRRLRQAGMSLPIVALTANASPADRQRCEEAGCTDFLTKPIDRKRFYAVCAAALQGTHGAT